VHAFVFPTALSYPNLGPNQPGDQTLVKIRFQ